MSKADTRTVEQVVLGLALIEVPCLECTGTGTIVERIQTSEGEQYSCPACRSTGKVAKYPMLREPCPGVSSFDQVVLDNHNLLENYICACGHICTDMNGWLNHLSHPSCCTCQGRGWRPVTTTDALLEAAFTLCWSVTVNKVVGNLGYLVILYTKEPYPRGHGVTKEMALALALEATTEANYA